MNELTLAIFKPDSFGERGTKNNVQQKFFDALKKENLDVLLIGEKFNFTPELLEAHYGFVKTLFANGAFIFDDLKNFFIPQAKNQNVDCQAMVIGGDDAIAKVRKIIGPTKFATWGLRKTSESAERDCCKNYIHASGTAKQGDPYSEAKNEIKRFFPSHIKNLKSNKLYKQFWGN